MIYTLSIECVCGAYLDDQFLRIVEVSSDMTLGELHLFILDLAKFGDDHLSTFYIANTSRGKKIWFTDTGDWEEENDAMWNIQLNKIFPLGPHKKLYYWFDFGDDWIFEIRKKSEKKFSSHPVKYPRLIHKEGPEPIQYPNWDDSL